MKKNRIISWILALVMIFALIGVNAVSETDVLRYLGDINQDSKVNGIDLLLMKQHILNVPGKILQNGTDEYTAADINGDSKINGMDLLLLKKHILDAANNPMPPWPTIIVLPTEIPSTDEITTDDTTNDITTGTTTVPTTTEPWPHVYPWEIETVGESTISPISNKEITLIWIDHFDTPALDTNKWATLSGAAWVGSATWNRNNVKQEDSKLIITSTSSGSAVTSGGVSSINKFFVKYGRIEARMKQPVGKGNWHAFFTMGQTDIYINNQMLNWPWCGEFDIMEYMGDNYATGYMHWADLPRTGDQYNPPVTYNNYGSQKKRYTWVSLGGGTNTIPENWYVFGIEWTPEKVIRYVRDEKTGIEVKLGEVRIDNNQTMSHAFHNPHYLILEQSMHHADQGGPFPRTFEIDWVKVWDIEGYSDTKAMISPRFTLDSENKIQ